jgi:hypothetical protein
MFVNEYQTDMRGFIIRSIAIGLLTDLFLVWFIHEEIKSASIELVILICAVVVPALLTVYVLSNKLIIRINQDDIEFIRFKKPIEYISFEGSSFEAYTHVVRFKYVFTSQKRYLRVYDSTNQYKDYSCDGLTQKDFDSFFEEVTGISAEKQLRVRRK